VLCCAVLCCAVLCCAVLCCAALPCAVLCCAVLCCAVLCCAVLSCAGGLGCGCYCRCRCRRPSFSLSLSLSLPLSPHTHTYSLIHSATPPLFLSRSLFHTNTHSLPQSNATAASQPSRYRPDAHVVIGHRYAHCHHHGVFGAAGHPRGRTNGCLSALPISPTCPLRQPLLQLRPAVCPPWPANCTKTIQMMKT
jgi:hypothetical protein